MQENTVVALYDTFRSAKEAVTEIVQAGGSRDHIAMLANDSTGDHPPLSINPAWAREEFDTDSTSQSGIVTGAELGIGVGGILGFLVGIGTIAIPGIGPLIALGTWASVAAGATAGGVVGGVIGALTDRGVSDEDAHLYAEGLRRGGTLVTMVVPADQVDKMTQIFKKHGAVDIEKRNAHWTAEGWVSFDPDAEPLTPEQIAAAKARAAGHEAEHHQAVKSYPTPGGA